MNKAKQHKRLFMILNCLALGIIAMNLTAPVHEATHLLTQMIAGAKPEVLAFGCAGTVEGTATANLDSIFWKVMFSGSAALMNILIGTVLLIVLKKARLGPLSRPLVLMTTLMHYSMGFGYFLRDFFLYDPDPAPDESRATGQRCSKTSTVISCCGSQCWSSEVSASSLYSTLRGGRRITSSATITIKRNAVESRRRSICFRICVMLLCSRLSSSEVRSQERAWRAF